MLNIHESDLFQAQDSRKVFTTKLNELLKKNSVAGMATNDILVLNTLLATSLDGMKRLYNEPIVLKILEAIADNKITLVSLSMAYNIPKPMPFIRYKASTGETKVIVNLTPYVEKRQNNLGEISYSVGVQKLYPILISAYLTMTTFNERYIPNAAVLSSSAFIWASMFNKVLAKTVALGTNKERYDAFMYFAMKFFCIYIMQTPVKIADDIANEYLTKRGRKDFPMLRAIEENINRKGYSKTMYTSLRGFCDTMFNNEITNLRGIISAKTSEMNESFFINQFINIYGYGALFALATYPYFVYVILNATMKTRIVSDQAFQDFITDKDYSSLKLLNGLI